VRITKDPPHRPAFTTPPASLVFINMSSHTTYSTSNAPVVDGTFTLGDGRRIAYNICGANNGYPVFHLHGWPGARTEVSLFALQAAELGARIIAIDRPGIGLSTPHPGRTVLDHALDIRQVAKHLGLKEYVSWA